MCQAVLSPNLTKKFQWEVSQIANNRFPCMVLLGGLSVNLNHLKTNYVIHPTNHKACIHTRVGSSLLKLSHLLFYHNCILLYYLLFHFSFLSLSFIVGGHSEPIASIHLQIATNQNKTLACLCRPANNFPMLANIAIL